MRDHVTRPALKLALRRHGFDAGEQLARVRAFGLQAGLQAAGVRGHAGQAKAAVVEALALQGFAQARIGAGRVVVHDGLEDQPPRKPVAGGQVELAAPARERRDQAQDVMVGQWSSRHGGHAGRGDGE